MYLHVCMTCDSLATQIVCMSISYLPLFVDFCWRAHLSVMEKGHGLTRDHSHTRPADVLIAGWDRGRPAAFDVTSLCPAILRESCIVSGAASTAVETCKLLTNGPKCQELGWTCIPLAVEMFCNWGKEAHLTFSMLASHLAISMSSPKPSVLADIYSRLNITLVKSTEPSWQGSSCPRDLCVL